MLRSHKEKTDLRTLSKQLESEHVLQEKDIKRMWNFFKNITPNVAGHM